MLSMEFYIRGMFKTTFVVVAREIQKNADAFCKLLLAIVPFLHQALTSDLELKILKKVWNLEVKIKLPNVRNFGSQKCIILKADYETN